MTDEPMREEPCSDKSTQRAQSEREWTNWHWSDSRLIRRDKTNLARIEECSSRSYLESELKSQELIRQEYLERASRSKSARAKELMQGVSDKDRQIAWVKQKLESLSDNQPALVKRVSVEVVETEELTSDEQRERLHLERKVERAFYEAGKALRELRDRRLYRSTHKTFEEYCLDRFGFKRRHPYQLINAAEVVDNLLEMCANRAQNKSGAPALPTSEYQVRPLVGLEPEQQREAWRQAVEEAKGKVPSSRLVKDIVQLLRERTPVPNPYKVGEVCQLIAQDNPDLRGKGGCWCIVEEVHDFGCTVQTWSGSYTVRLEHLKSLEYTSEECQQMKGLSARLLRLHSEEPSEAARAVLKNLGHLKRPYLTALEEKLLSFLETEYEITTDQS